VSNEAPLFEDDAISRILTPDTALPTQMTPTRLVEYMTRNNFTFFSDEHGDLFGIWDRRNFVFSVREDGMLQVRAMWQREASIDRLEALLEALNYWNESRIWPKTYLRVDDGGGVVMFAEQNHLLTDGITDTQLDDLVDCAISTSLMFFDFLEETFPDPLKEAM